MNSISCFKPTSEAVPVEAFAGRQRRGWHNRRRERDPLGEGQPGTCGTRLIKVAAASWRETSRCVVVELSASWPYWSTSSRSSNALAISASPDLHRAQRPETPAAARRLPAVGRGDCSPPATPS